MSGRGDEITTKFKVDISDLKAGITKANQEIKLANAQFKVASAGMDDWKKSTEGIQAKLQQLDSVLASQKSKLQSYHEQLKRQQDAYNENGKRAEELKNKLQQLASQGVEKTSEEYKQYQKALNDVEKEQLSNEKAMESLKVTILNQQAAVNGTEKEIRNYNATLDKMESEAAQAAEAANKQKNAYESLQSTIDKQQSELNELKNKYANVVLEQGKNSSSAQKLASEIDKLSGELNDNKAKLNEADKAAEELDQSLVKVEKTTEEASGGFTVMKGALANLVASGIQAAIEGLKNLATASYEAWKAYDEGADTIIAATGATGKAAEELIEVYEKVSKNVVAEFSDIGTAVGEVNTRFGTTGDELQKTSEKFLKFAEINGVDVKTAIDNTQAAMAAFGLEAKDTSNMIDVLNKAGQDTGVSVAQLAASLVSNAPALQEMGYNAAEAAMFIANLEKNGVDASSTLAGMKKALANAAAEGKPMSAAMSDIEKSIKNANSSTEAITIATELFGAKAGPAIATAVKSGKLSFQDFGTTLTDFQGNVETTYNTMLDGPDKIALAMQNLKLEAAKVFDAFLQQHGPKIETMVTKFTENILPKLMNIMDKIMDGIGWIIDHGDAIATVLTAMAAGVGAYVAYTTALKIMREGWMALEIAQKAVTVAQLALNTAMKANPIGLVISAITALIAIIVKVISKLKENRNAIKDTQKAQEDLTKAKKAAADAELDYVGAVDRATDAQRALEEAEKASGLSGKALFDQIQQGTLDYANLNDEQKEVYKAYLENEAAQKAVKESTENLTNAKKAETVASLENQLALAKESQDYGTFKKAVVEAFEAGKISTEEARKLMVAAMGEMSKSAQQAFVEDIPADIKSGLSTDVYEAGGKALVEWFGTKWSNIKDKFKDAPAWFGEKFGNAWTNIKDKFTGWSQYWGGLWDQVKNKFSGIGTKIGDAIGGAVKSGINGVIGMIERTINKAIGLINGAINIINNIPGVEIKKISKLNLPRLAKGGVLKKGQVGLLEGSGAEAVVPLEKNKQWIRAVANDLRRQLQGNSAGALGGNLTNNREYNFTQIINAPKQPSRIELYRQTRNLLAYANTQGGI